MRQFATLPTSICKRLAIAGFTLTVAFCLTSSANAQTEVTGAIEGTVTSSQSPNGPVAGATVRIMNLNTQVPSATKTDANGHFIKNSLQPGRYQVIVRADNFEEWSSTAQRVDVQVTNTTVPLPISLHPSIAAATPTPTETPQPGVSPSPAPAASPTATGGTTKTSVVTDETSIKTELNTTDARRGGAYRDKDISTLPLGGTTLTRTFDELALLLPGVAPPPQTLGDVAGPGVGAGVGSAGQFSVNGMRSRANNFTVDGSDNNDEDIGVRRQGFFALVPQSTDSIQEFRVTSLLAPAQYGRNFGGQINAVSKSGGNGFHGSIFGLINSSQLNARNVFDTTNGNATTAIRSEGGQAVLDCTGFDFSNGAAALRANCIARNRSLTTTNQSADEDSFTLGQGGGVFGGPIKKDKAFFFVSYERLVLNASKEASFAVPTVDQRGIFRSGATGFYIDCLDPNTPGFNVSNCNNANRNRFFQDFAFPTTLEGDAIFSLMPFANNPTGIYGANTFTEVLPAGARGHIASGKYDQNFNLGGKPQTLTARYNFTQDWRIIPVTGGALFSSLKPQVTTQNISTFLNSEISSSVNNVLRLSYGRTRLGFDEVRDPFLVPSQVSPNSPFLLNARLLENDTLPAAIGVPNTGPVLYRNPRPNSVSATTECGFNNNCQFGSGLGRVGQVNIAGFSPIGADVNFFPQKRVNNTYQLADTVNWRARNHRLAFGADIRRVELNADLPPRSRTLLTFNGSPEFNFFSPTELFTNNFITGADLAATGSPSGAFLSLARRPSAIGLRYYESDAFFQDEFRFHSNMSINLGVRYEYNTPPREVHNVIENTFNDPALNDPNVVGLKTFIAGRTQIFDRDRNNFVPRIGFAWSPNLFEHRSTVIRAGFGVYHDQILGAVVSQSRNVYPNFVTSNTGGFSDLGFGNLGYFNPARGGIITNGVFVPLVQPGTLNTFNPNLTLAQYLSIFASGGLFAGFPNPISETLPDRFMRTPYAEQYSANIDQQVGSNTIVSVGYVGTHGHNLLRASTPNLGQNNVILLEDACGLACGEVTPILFGFALAPGFDRPTPNVGPVYIYESLGRSHYDALQVQVRGRFVRGLQYQANYTYSNAVDDASDVFDLAGSNALPQNSLTRTGETAPSNFDAHHRVAYNVIYDFPKHSNGSGFYNAVFGGLQLASTGSFQTGQPFTVNSINDVNLDGNLTDRLDTTQGIVITGDRSQPIALAPGVNTRNLLAAIGEDGRIARNTFRAGNFLNLDFSLLKGFSMGENRKLVFRMDIFNFINRANYGIPVRQLEAPGFGRATSTVTPGRRIQFGLKFDF